MTNPSIDDVYLTRARDVTRKHIARVKELMLMASEMIAGRGLVHDDSKFEMIELEPLARMQQIIDRDGQAPYQSDEYKRRTAMLKQMLDHHYAKNSHHPEHYGAAGVNGMCLFDVLEMFMDWKAASERGEESHMSLSIAIERYKIEPQLANVMINTATKLEFPFQ